jgi:hypothetical protein
LNLSPTAFQRFVEEPVESRMQWKTKIGVDLSFKIIWNTKCFFHDQET